MTTGLVYVPALGHTLVGHPEHAGRLEAVWQLLTEKDILQQVAQIEPQPATVEQLLRVHEYDHIANVEWAAEQARMIGGDTYVTPETFEAARLAAGGCCNLLDALLTGQIKNGMALVRPPGHHAGRSTVEGFCLFNNIAAAARHAQAVHGVERVAIIDFDVHHGNGTQDIFYTDESVMFFSLQMVAPFFYPGSGRMHEVGKGPGSGYSVNVPITAGADDATYLHVFDEVIEPLLTPFRPNLILISTGFDAHWRDPLAHVSLSLQGFAALSRRLIGWADRLCEGKIAFVLEGGYDLEVLSYGVLNTIYALLKQDEVCDPVGFSAESPPKTASMTDLLVKLSQYHLLG